MHEHSIDKLFEFINIQMFNYQIVHLQSVSESRLEFLVRFVLCANYSEFTPIFTQVLRMRPNEFENVTTCWIYPTFFYS